MYKKAGKKLLLGLMVLAMVVTSIAVMPTNAQAAKKKTPKATIDSWYKEPGIWMSGQLGYLEKHPYNLNKESYMIANRNKKAKYTYYSSNSQKVKISKAGKITSVKGNDGDVVKITVKETYKKKTRTVGKVKIIVANPKILNQEVTWYVGSVGMFCPQDVEGWISKKDAEKYYGDCAAFACGAYQWISSDEQFDPQEKLKEINGDGSSDTSDSGKYFDWDAENAQFKIKEEGKLYFAYYALNYKTNQYYYVGSFVANLKKCTEAKSVYITGDLGMEDVEVGDKITTDIEVDPMEYIGDVKVTSSDPKVATVTLSEDKRTIEIKALKNGKTTITVEVNGAKDTLNLYVGDDDWEDDDL